MKTLALILCLTAAAAAAASEKSSSALPRGAPEAQGISSAAILEFVQAADRQVKEMNSFMLVRHGHVVAEGWWTPYAAETPHMLYSLSKSFTSTAVGLAVSEGKLSIDDEVLKFFPEDAPAASTNNLKAMRVRDLLCMSTGHQTEVRLSETNEFPWTKAFLAHPVPHKPGTHFLYNTAGTYMQSAIVQKVTGLTVLDYLRPRLFDPLGIENPTWGTSPQGISLGGYGLNIRTEEIAKFGLLYLQKGRWHGKQLVPAAWVEAATARQTSNGSNPKSDWDQGYGYQFWRCRHGAYRGDGAFGQYCLVMPEQDAVIAITSGTRDMQGVLNLIWDKLLPAMQSEPLPANEGARKELERALSKLILPMPQGAASSLLAAKISSNRFVFPANAQKLEAITYDSASGRATTLVVRVNGADHRLASSHGAWQKGRMAYGSLTNQPVAVAGAWTADDTYTAKFCFHETPTCVTANLKFSGDQLLYDAEYNVAFGPTKQPQLVGRSE
ncbi:MAG TPA: serine hydrolase [Verrucomicrobiae bacterium]|nr:serine hydrolase [Verrucomicrobiae bacterium]